MLKIGFALGMDCDQILGAQNSYQDRGAGDHPSQVTKNALEYKNRLTFRAIL